MKQDIPVLTSLRFFAASLIVLQHSAGHFGIFTELAKGYTLIQGVTFFFVLSGFILTVVHSKIEGRSQATRFLWARVARVWPAHLFTMLAFVVVFMGVIGTGYQPTAGEWLSNLFLLQAWRPVASSYFAFNGVAWTLSVEMFFYAMFPLLIWRLSETWPWKLALSLGLVLVALWLIDYTGAQPRSDDPNAVTYASYLYIWPPARLSEFVLGMIAGTAYLKWGKDLVSRSTLCGITGLLIIIAAGAVIPNLEWNLGGFFAPAGMWLKDSGAAAFFALGLFLIAPGNGAAQKALSYRPLVVLGEISFSVYLVHQLVIRVLIIKPDLLGWMPAAMQMAVCWSVILVLSYLLWRLWEKPCRRLMLSIPVAATLPRETRRERQSESL